MASVAAHMTLYNFNDGNKKSKDSVRGSCPNAISASRSLAARANLSFHNLNRHRSNGCKCAVPPYGDDDADGDDDG